MKPVIAVPTVAVSDAAESVIEGNATGAATTWISDATERALSFTRLTATTCAVYEPDATLSKVHVLVDDDKSVFEYASTEVVVFTKYTL